MKDDYKILKRLMLLIITISSITYGHAQTRIVSGKVTSSEDGASGASVFRRSALGNFLTIIY